MRQLLTGTLTTALLAALPGWAAAQATPASADTQAVVPQVERRAVQPPRFPSRDFEIGVFAGSYATQSFGTSAVVGLRLGYHITEDVFVEAALAQTKVSDAVFRQVYPDGIYPSDKETLRYYNLSAGFNVLPGEVFIGRGIARPFALYLIGGIGSTRFVDKRLQTFNLGFGTRVLLGDRLAVQADVRDHVFTQDILGKRQSAQNLEVTAGLTYFF